MPYPCVAILDDYGRLAASSPAVAELRNFADVRIFETRIPAEELPAARLRPGKGWRTSTSGRRPVGPSRPIAPGRDVLRAFYAGTPGHVINPDALRERQM